MHIRAISKLQRIFSTHGIPKIVRSDNGPPFTSKIFMNEYGIQHQQCTPLWPQANSEAERFMKPLMKAVRSARLEGRDWHKELYVFLLNYRATPRVTIGYQMHCCRTSYPIRPPEEFFTESEDYSAGPSS